MKTDDVGSFPCEEREELQEIAHKIVLDTAAEAERERFNAMVRELMQAKISTGLDCPSYPQLHEMIENYFLPIEKFSADEPWVIEKEKAIIPEVEALRDFDKQIDLKVCITGPLDIYVRKVSTQVDGDLLANLAKSVSRFLKNSILDDNVKTTSISIDEPSYGLNPNIVLEEEDLIRAWDIATEPAKDLDIQIHLHSSAEVGTVYKTKHIKIIGVEAAENPINLDSLDKNELIENDRFLRVGIARSNITALLADYEQKTGKKATAVGAVDALESVDVIRGRLDKAIDLFGDRVKYVGPDCGLGLWPGVESAAKLLENTVKAVKG